MNDYVASKIVSEFALTRELLNEVKTQALPEDAYPLYPLATMEMLDTIKCCVEVVIGAYEALGDNVKVEQIDRDFMKMLDYAITGYLATEAVSEVNA